MPPHKQPSCPNPRWRRTQCQRNTTPPLGMRPQHSLERTTPSLGRPSAATMRHHPHPRRHRRWRQNGPLHLHRCLQVSAKSPSVTQGVHVRECLTCPLARTTPTTVRTHVGPRWPGPRTKTLTPCQRAPNSNARQAGRVPHPPAFRNNRRRRGSIKTCKPFCSSTTTTGRSTRPRLSTQRPSVKRSGMPSTGTPRPRDASPRAIKCPTPRRAIGPGRRGHTPRHQPGIHGEARSEAHMRTPRPEGTPLRDDMPDGPGPTYRRQAERGNTRARRRHAHTRSPKRQGGTLNHRPGPASIIEVTSVPPAPTARDLPLPPPSHRQGTRGHTPCLQWSRRGSSRVHSRSPSARPTSGSDPRAPPGGATPFTIEP